MKNLLETNKDFCDDIMRVPFNDSIMDAREKGFLGLVYSLLLTILFQFVFLSITVRQIAYKLFSSDILVEVNGSKMILNVNDNGISNDLFVYGKREFLTFDYLINSGVIKNGDVVLDIGANIGYYVLLELKLVGKSGKIYAVEPSSKNFEALKRNISINDYSNIQFFHSAMGEENTNLNLYISDHSNLCSMNKSAGVNYISEETVEVMSVDSFLIGKEHPQLIRMDVEGFEYNILKGMKETIKKPVKLLIEIHGNLMKKEQSIALLHELRNNGFEIDFAAYDETCLQHKLSHILLKKLGKSLPISLSSNWNEIENWIIEKRQAAQLCLRKS